MPNFIEGSLPVTFNASVVAAIQDKTLSRVFRDAAYPRLMFRVEANPELWVAAVGTNQTFTRPGLLAPTTRPLVAGVEPDASTYDIEQWYVTAAQWGKSIPTSMSTSYTSLASLYLRNIHQLGLHAGQSLNRVARDHLFNAYTAGNTVIDVAGVAGAFTVHVPNLCGFTHKLLNGTQQAVGAGNPLPVSFGPIGAPVFSCNVIGASSDNGTDLLHGGTLTLDTAIPAGGLAIRTALIAQNASRLIYAGGGSRVDDITLANKPRVADFRAAVAQLRADNMQPHDDGQFHVHVDPVVENNLFDDNEFQRLHQGLPDGIAYQKMAVGATLGMTFYRNTEAPSTTTCSNDPKTGWTHSFETVNPTNVAIRRSIVTAGGALEEKYLDEAKYISAAGIMGKIGEFAITNNGVQVMAERIRLVMRAPLDALQQVTTSSWSFSGGFGVPTDALNPTSPAAFKRAAVVVSC